MAMAKQRAEWVRTGVMVSWLVAAFSGKNIHPNKVIPPQFRPPKPPPPQKSKVQIESESRRAWKLMERAFGLPPKPKPPRGK